MTTLSLAGELLVPIARCPKRLAPFMPPGPTFWEVVRGSCCYGRGTFHRSSFTNLDAKRSVIANWRRFCVAHQLHK
jgi:hypothetical protein